MDFEWDEAKRLVNVSKHGIDFVRAQELFDGRPVVSQASRRDREPRWKTVSVIGGRFVTVIWTERRGRIRMISARGARDEEKKAYRALHGR